MQPQVQARVQPQPWPSASPLAPDFAPRLAFVSALAFVAVGTSPANAWLDAGELGAAGFELGVMHPPGTPGLAAVLQIATWIPLGPLGWRLALVSSVAAAIVAAVTMRLLQRRGVHPLVSWGAIAWLFAGMTLLRHARGVELYAPQLAAIAVVADAFDPARDPGRDRTGLLQVRCWGTFVATWAIWGFAELRLLLPPMLLAVWISAVRQRRPYALWAPLVVVFASACVFVIPLSAARSPITSWGDPQTWSTMVDHVLARSIRTAFADEMLPASWPMWLANADAAITRMGEDLGPSGPIVGVVALVGAWVGPARPGDRAAIVTISAWTLGSFVYAVGINPMGGVDRQTGLVLLWCVVLLVAVLLDRPLQDRPRVRQAVLPVVWTVLVVPAAIRSSADFGSMPSWAPHAWTRGALAQLPTRSLLLTQSDDLSAGLTWARVIEGARPDVVTHPGQHLHKPPGPFARAQHPAMWQAVADARSEAQRIEAAIAAHDGPVALEHAGSGVFAAVRFDGAFAALPLAITTSTTPPDLREQIATWLPRLPSAEDRRRLAVAIAEWARGHVRRGGDPGVAVAALQTTLTDVDPAHLGSMITLGGLFDRLGDPTSAIEWTRRALAIDPTRQVALLNLALYLARDADRDPRGRAAAMAEATAFAERAVDLRPWRPEVWMRLAEVRAADGDVAGAQAAQARAQAISTSPR